MFLCNIAVSAQERNPNRLILHKGGEILKTYSADEIDDITFDYVSNKEVGITVLNVDNNSCKVKFEMPDSCASYLVGAIPAESSEDLVQYLLKNNTAVIHIVADCEKHLLLLTLNHFAYCSTGVVIRKLTCSISVSNISSCLRNKLLISIFHITVFKCQ